VEDDIERIIDAALTRRSGANPAALRRTILEFLWDAGYDVTHRPDMIPIVRNPGEDRAGR
jgi:hypothetical protein